MKITESEKNKLKIEKLKEEKDNLEFEFSQNQTTFIGILAILISIFIPAILISEIKFECKDIFEVNKKIELKNLIGRIKL